MTTTDDLYTTITQHIINDLEKGELTWRLPWNSGFPVTLPLRKNDVPYSGINTVMLWLQATKKGYRSPYWMTYRQAQEMKAQVRKGEKAATVVYFDTILREEKGEDGTVSAHAIPFMKRYAVFNAEQIEGLPDAFYVTPDMSEGNAEMRIDEIEAFFAKTGACIDPGMEARYNPDYDRIEMPPFEYFEDARSYYATLAHEVIHWTGHVSRLRREFNRRSENKQGYAMEELIAELGACFLAADLGLEPVVHAEHAAYIQSWLSVLKDDKRFIFHAAAQAQRAVTFVKEEVKRNGEITGADVLCQPPALDGNTRTPETAASRPEKSMPVRQRHPKPPGM